MALWVFLSYIYNPPSLKPIQKTQPPVFVGCFQILSPKIPLLPGEIPLPPKCHRATNPWVHCVHQWTRMTTQRFFDHMFYVGASTDMRKTIFVVGWCLLFLFSYWASMGLVTFTYHPTSVAMESEGYIEGSATSNVILVVTVARSRWTYSIWNSSPNVFFGWSSQITAVEHSANLTPLLWPLPPTKYYQKNTIVPPGQINFFNQPENYSKLKWLSSNHQPVIYDVTNNYCASRHYQTNWHRQKTLAKWWQTKRCQQKNLVEKMPRLDFRYSCTNISKKRIM